MAKKKFSFFSNESKKTNIISDGYSQYTGRQISSGNTSPGNQKFTQNKTSLEKAKDDFLMDIGAKDKDIGYYARLDDRSKRSQQVVENMRSRRNSSGSKGETAAQRVARLKREALKKEKAEGQEKRKKFYKEKGERLAKLKTKLLNLA